MPSKVFVRLLFWEFKKGFRVPVIEIISLLALYVLFSSAIQFSSSKMNVGEIRLDVYESFSESLAITLGFSFLSLYNVMSIVYPVLVANSFAGEFSRGETRLVFSYPLRRRDIFLAKTISFLFVPYLIFLIYALFMFYLVGFSFTRFIPYIFIISLIVGFLQAFFVYSFSLVIALYVKDAAISFLASVLLLYGLDYASRGVNPPIKYFIPPRCFDFVFMSMAGRMSMFSGYFPYVASVYVIMSLLFFFGSFFYFCKVMEV